MRSPYQLLDGALARRELTFRLRLPVVGNSLVTGDPALIAEVVKSRDLIGGRGTEALRPVVGDHSLIALEGDRHLDHRNALLPHFFTSDARRHAAMMGKWTSRAIDRLPVGETFKGSDLVAGITLHVMVEMIFGELGDAAHDDIIRRIEAWLASFSNPAILFLKPLHLDLGRFSAWGRFLANRARVHEFIRGQIAHVSRGEADGGVLGALLRARAAGSITLDDEELVSEVVTFLLFGHDTSAQTMGWVFHHLWNDAQALDTAGREVAAAGADGDLPFLRSAIQESMRLCPVVVHLTRHAVTDTGIGGHAVPEGTRVLPCLYLAHRNPDVFEQPSRYLPERFLAPQAHWRYAYFPFGLGQRLCAGMPLALQQMLVVASRLMSECTLEAVAPQAVRPVRKMVLIVPSGGPLMRRVR